LDFPSTEQQSRWARWRGQGRGGRHKCTNSINVFISGHKRAVQKHGILLGPRKYAPDFDWIRMDNGMKCETKQLPNLISYILPYHMWINKKKTSLMNSNDIMTKQ
jgi:hypothetical protein